MRGERLDHVGFAQPGDGIPESVAMHVLDLDSTLRDTIAPILSLLGALPNDEQLALEHPQTWLSQLPDLAVAIERSPGRPESVSIVRAYVVPAPMTDVIIVVIALIVTAFAVALPCC